MHFSSSSSSSSSKFFSEEVLVTRFQASVLEAGRRVAILTCGVTKQLNTLIAALDYASQKRIYHGTHIASGVVRIPRLYVGEV